MDDARLWGSEQGLWTASPDHYREIIAPEALMVLPDAPYVFSGEAAVAAVSRTPQWTDVVFEDQQVSRPQEGWIVIAYGVSVSNAQDRYAAVCTTTYRRLDQDVWRVVQHHQSPRPAS